MAELDVIGFFTLFVFFLLLGVFLPFINSAFEQPQIIQDTSALSSLSDESLTTNSVGVLEVIISVATIFFWSFGQVYWAVDLVLLMPLRVFAAYLLIRMVRGI